MQSFGSLIYPLMLPLIIGVILWRRPGEFPRLAAVWTLKPLVATPLWWLLFYLIVASAGPDSSSIVFAFLGLPGIILTVIILKRYAGDAFYMHPKASWALLVLDTIRWTSSSWIVWFWYPAAFVALAMPRVFAIVALVVAPSEENPKEHKVAETRDEHAANSPY